jgi:L-gulonate 5-dehydrogenase
VVAIGLPVGTAPVRPGILPAKEIDVFGSSCACLPDFSEAVRLVNQYRSAVGKLLTHRFPLARTADAFEFALKHEPGAVKILVTINAAEGEM